MSSEPAHAIENVEGKRAAARSLAYSTFARMFEYPDREQNDAIRSGALAALLRKALLAVDPAVDGAVNWDALQDAGEEDDLAVEFTRLFDVGSGTPPCPLDGGLYFGTRMKTMEEAVRFYNFFGLTLSQAPHELPDHVTTELEFLHFLAFREAEAFEAGGDPGPWRRAQRDFVARHPGRWIPELRKRLEREQPMRFFWELVCGLASFLESESLYLEEAATNG
ncbi:MAG: molecular chaperone TorD family protein [Myxococcota bacterium]